MKPSVDFRKKPSETLENKDEFLVIIKGPLIERTGKHIIWERKLFFLPSLEYSNVFENCQMYGYYDPKTDCVKTQHINNSLIISRKRIA